MVVLVPRHLSNQTRTQIPHLNHSYSSHQAKGNEFYPRTTPNTQASATTAGGGGGDRGAQTQEREETSGEEKGNGDAEEVEGDGQVSGGVCVGQAVG